MYNGIDLTCKQQQKASIQCLLLLVIIEQRKNALQVKHLLVTMHDLLTAFAVDHTMQKIKNVVHGLIKYAGNQRLIQRTKRVLNILI
jgi:hypothetical protein